MILFSKSIAMIRYMNQDEAFWLLRWNEQQEQAGFIESPRLEGESYREALFREIDWQLGLDRKRDYLLSSVPRIHFELSPCGNVHPAKSFDYEKSDFGVVEIFTAEVYRDSVKSRLDQDPLNCWSRTKEVVSGVDGQGRSIRLDQYQMMIQTESIGRSC